MMQSGDGSAHHYGHHAPTVPMDLHMPQPFSYYSCIMDNNAMFAAQQVQYNRMYGGLDAAAGRRTAEELGAQSSINSRILELRKEKSRDAARSRRGKENHEFYELAKMLPLPNAITSQLDKASIIRLTIAYLKLREFAANGEPGWTKDTSQQQRLKTNALRSICSQRVMEDFEKHEGTHILQSLDGFAISLNADGRFLYISETVSIYLGLSQVEMTGSSFFDYVHQADHQELADQLGVTLAHQTSRSGSAASTASGPDETSVGATPAIPDGKPLCYPVTSMMHAKVDRMTGKPTYDRAFCVRMKSTLTKRGCHFKSSGYRVVLLLGKLRPAHSTTKAKNPSQVMGFIGLAIALPPPSVHEVRLESDMFVTRLTFDFKIAHCEPKVSELLDYTAEELTGQSLYSLCHGEDVHKLRRTHEDLLNKGQVMSNYFRILNRTGGYSWMQSCATLICNTKNADEQSIICVNYVLSGPQFSNIVMDQCQNPDSKIHVQTSLKDSCKLDYSDNDASQTKLEKMSPSSVEIKLRPFVKESVGVDDGSEGSYGHHILPTEDMRMAQQATSYHVSNSSNKDWPFWRPPTLI